MSTSTPKVGSATALEEVTNHMSNLWNSGDRSDLTIICRSEVFNVHTLVICPRSPFFAAASQGAWKEATSKRIELPDDNPGAVKRMLQYCYGMGYDQDSSADETQKKYHDSRAHMNAEIYMLADKYDIGDLKQVAAIQFRWLMQVWAKDNAILPVFSLVRLVYGGTPDSDGTLRKPVVHYAQLRWSELSSHPDVKTFLAENSAFALDLLNSTPLKVLTKPEFPYRSSCRACHSTDQWRPSRVTCSCGRWEDVTRQDWLFYNNRSWDNY